jgi:hypothetical protein
MIVEFKTGEGIKFPALCPCCGEKPDGTTAIRSYSFKGRTMTTRTWEVPYCTVCSTHRNRFVGAPGMPTPLTPIDLVLIVVTCGLWAVLWRLFVYPKKERARAAAADVERAEAKKLLKPGCGAVEGLKYTSKGDVHVFDVPSSPWVEAFRAANGL